MAHAEPSKRRARSAGSVSETRRLVDQMFHYSLLNKLHTPHMLRSSTEHKYSKIMCVNASRELLSRFIMFRSLNQIASSFRVMDFLALMAGLTLLLAHLDSCNSKVNCRSYASVFGIVLDNSRDSCIARSWIFFSQFQFSKTQNNKLYLSVSTWRATLGALNVIPTTVQLN